jgi:MFS family permease
MKYQDIRNIRYDPERNRRVFFSALSGFVVGSIATCVTAYVNVWRFPELPIHLDWAAIFVTWLLLAVVGGILAGVAGFSHEGWKSILLSAVGISLTLLLYSSAQSSESMTLKIVALVGMLFPIAAMVSPLPLIFFWLASRFVQAASSKIWMRFNIVFVNCLMIVGLGALSGLYARMDARAEQGMRLIHEIIQDAAQTGALHTALLKTAGFSAHKDQPYTLSQTPSAFSTVGVDITVHYDDGYTMTCTVVLYPGRDPAVYPCKGQLPYEVPHK